MASLAKYIVFQDEDSTPGNEKHCVVFPNVVFHDDMAAAYMHRCASFVVPIGAGFVTITKDLDNCVIVAVHGESKSLHIKSRPEDAEVIRKCIIEPGL